MTKPETIEARLRRAFERGLELGYYPEDGTYGNDTAGCCALGMFGVVTGQVELDDACDTKKYLGKLGLKPHEAGYIIAGFDDCDFSYDESDEDVGLTEGRAEEMYAIGKKLREDFYLCDGEEPRYAEVNPAAA